jgi:hypothetical protein
MTGTRHFSCNGNMHTEYRVIMHDLSLCLQISYQISVVDVMSGCFSLFVTSLTHETICTSNISLCTSVRLF